MFPISFAILLTLAFVVGSLDEFRGNFWNKWDNSYADNQVLTDNTNDNQSNTCSTLFLAAQLWPNAAKFNLVCDNPIENADCLSNGMEHPIGSTASMKCGTDHVNIGLDKSRVWKCTEGGHWQGGSGVLYCINTAPKKYEESEDNVNDWRWETGQSQDQLSTVGDNNQQSPTEEPLLDVRIGDVTTVDVLTEEDLKLLYSTPTAAPIVDNPWAEFLKSISVPTITTTTPPPTTSTTTPPPTTTTTTPRPTPTQPGWTSVLDQPTVRKCPPLSTRTGMTLNCFSKIPVPSYPDAHIVSNSDCSTHQFVGTEATYVCAPFYESTLGLSKQLRICKKDGTWTGGNYAFACNLECGKFNIGKVPLIAHGEATNQAQWPWHAALFYQKARSPIHDYICGATLITSRAVITAAHCVVEGVSKIKTLSDFRIDLGRYRRAVDDEYVQTFGAESIIPHANYNNFNYDSDIAIIILDAPVAVGYHVRPICYPQNQGGNIDDMILYPGSIGTAVGFGANENNEFADVLQMARLRVISHQDCTASYADSVLGSTLTKSTTFCAGLQNGTNVCNGDSGSGIYFAVSGSSTFRWYLQGLVSVGISLDGEKRCDPMRNSVFTKVAAYDDWILRTLSAHDALF